MRAKAAAEYPATDPRVWQSIVGPAREWQPRSPATPTDDSPNRSPQDLEIQPQTPGFYVLNIEGNASLEGRILARGHLPQPGNSGHKVQSLQMLGAVVPYIVGR